MKNQIGSSNKNIVTYSYINSIIKSLFETSHDIMSKKLKTNELLNVDEKLLKMTIPSDSDDEKKSPIVNKKKKKNKEEEENFLVKYGGKNYEISDFLKKHPGGSKILQPFKGLSLDVVLTQIPHSEAALHIFQEFIEENKEDYDSIEVSLSTRLISNNNKKLFRNCKNNYQ